MSPPFAEADVITIEQVYGTPDEPDKIPVFKDFLPGDVENVFFNLNEFAEMHFVDEKEMPCIVQKPGVLPYDAHWQAGAKQSSDEGLYRADLVLYVKQKDYGPMPKSGKQLTLDKKRLFKIKECSQKMGVYRMELERVR